MMLTVTAQPDDAVTVVPEIKALPPEDPHEPWVMLLDSPVTTLGVGVGVGEGGGVEGTVKDMAAP